MNPGLVVKLRPAGPWRIGPDSGARNRVDFIYHSDSLYAAVVSAMARLGSLDAWLDATARRSEDAARPAVCFSSCFPFVDEIGFVVPPRTVWPPVSRALKSARVRWKSARFVPLGVVQAILDGQRLDENHWIVDGASECLVPAGRLGPFRTAVRWSAAVDRLTGSTERHSTACLEFRPGAGLWTIVSFADEAAHTRWLEPVKAAFRLLADTGFGGERSRGWGRAESPEFIDGTLPGMILRPREPAAPTAEPVGQITDLPGESAAEPIPEAFPVDMPAQEPAVMNAAPLSEAPIKSPVESAAEPAAPEESRLSAEPAATAEEAAAGQKPPENPESPVPVEEPPAPQPPSGEPPVEEPPSTEPPVEEPPADSSEPTQASAAVRAPSQLAELTGDPLTLPPTAEEPPASILAHPLAETSLDPVGPVPPNEAASPVTSTEPENPERLLLMPPHEPAAESPVPEPAPPPAPEAPPTPNPQPPTPAFPYWLLSLYTPASGDAVDWRRGNYTVLGRGGRVDSPAGSGELKKQIRMISEGSVVYAPTGPCGSAADVAPDGFVHPVFRAGFAVSIPLPEVS